MKYPTVTLGGKDYDIYDIAEALEITSPPLFNAFKKIIRRGNGAKSEVQDLEEAKQSIDRYLRDKKPRADLPFLKDEWIRAKLDSMRRERELLGKKELRSLTPVQQLEWVRHGTLPKSSKRKPKFQTKVKL